MLIFFLLRKHFCVALQDVVAAGLAGCSTVQMSPIGTSRNLTLGLGGAAGRAARSEQPALGQRKRKRNGETNNQALVQTQPGGTGANASATNC